MTAPEEQAAEVLVRNGLRPRYAVRLAAALAPLFAEERRKGAAGGWDEGYRTCGMTYLSGHRGGSTNPYRERADTYAEGGEPVADVLDGTNVTANTWQTAARRLAEENRRLRNKVEDLADNAWTMEDHGGNEVGPLVFADDLRAALSDEPTP